ncbi:MAG: cyclic nucleotide-binding domain-containing protein [Dehalococcoidia bacterium]
MAALADSLARVPLFKDLNKSALGRLERVMRERTFKAGDTIVSQGDEGVGFYLITAGKVEVTRDGMSLATLSTDDWFGEQALLDNYRRSATVKALEDTKTLAVMRSDFVAELRNNPDLAVEVLAVMSRRLREVEDKLTH